MKWLPLSVLLFALAPNVTAELPTWIELADRARWAANAHNVQSWRLASVVGRLDKKRLILDPARRLPQTDPFDRQLTISLGAFLAVLEDEAEVRGARITWEPLESEPGARVTLSEGPVLTERPGRIDALTAATVKYRTTAWKAPTELVDAQETDSGAGIRVQFLTEAEAVREAKIWAQGAYDLEMNLARTRDESIAVTRYGEAARRAQPWGITLAPNFPRDQLFWVELGATWFPQTPSEYARSARQLLTQALGPMQPIVVITSQGNDNRARLETGRRLQRLWQEVRASGGDLLPLSQGLQEFPEMAGFYAEAHRRWAQPGETVQMVLGAFRPNGGPFLPSPRLPASAVLD